MSRNRSLSGRPTPAKLEQGGRQRRKLGKVVAIGMAIPSIILVALDGGSLEASVTLLAIGLLALALAYLSESE